MKSIMTFIGVLIVLATIAAVFYGGYLAVGYVWQLYAGLEATLRLILLSSFSVFLVGCFMVSSAIKTATQLKLKGRLTESKIDLYKLLVDLYGQYFSGSHAGIKISRQDVISKQAAFKTEVNVVAGSAVVDCYRKLATALTRDDGDEKLQSLYQQLIRKMRQDLGHGTHFDETKLKFLDNQKQTTKPESEGHGVSA